MPYLTPDEIPEDDTCRPLSIPASAEWLAIVSGALTELTKSWNWEAFGSVTVDEAVARMQMMIDDYYADACGACELPEGGSIVRLNEDYVVEELIDGEWQSPSETYTIPPPAERTDPTSEQRICLAAKNAENILHQAYEEITDSATASLTVIEALAVLGTFLIAAVAAPLGAVVVALAALGIASWKVGYDIVEFVTSDFWDTDFTDNFTCALIRCATDVDGVVTFDFEAVNAELINQIEWLDPTISSYTLAGQVRWLIAQFGAEGLNAAGGTTEITDDDCSFCEPLAWGYRWLLTESDGDFVNDVESAGASVGTWNTAAWVTTFYGPYCAGGDLYALQIRTAAFDLDVGSTITRLAMMPAVAGGNSCNHAEMFVGTDRTDGLARSLSIYIDGAYSNPIEDIGEITEENGLFLGAGINSFDNTGQLFGLEIEGTGTMPDFTGGEAYTP